MNKHTYILARVALALLLAAGGYGLYRLGVAHGMPSGAPVQAGAAEKAPLYWHDPMYPGQKFDKPGKSPFMDMQLVPVYADDASDEGKVSISPRIQQNLGIRTALALKGRLQAGLSAVGNIAYNERDLAVVQARSTGFVEKLHVRAPLESVRKGQPLLELYVPDWIAAQEEFLTVQRMQGSGADGLLDAARQRMRLAGMSDAQIRLVESGGKVQSRVTITAPIAGVVTELAAREGMTVMPGAALMRINGTDTVWINAEVPEVHAGQVRPGSMVEARVAAWPGETFAGKVTALLPEVNAATRTLKARIELANPSGRLAPGMFATLSFASQDTKEVTLIPTEAVIQTGTRAVVMTMQAEGKFLPVEVEIGREANGQTEIRKGLEPGQKVVVSGQFLLDSEASLKGTATRMAEMPGNPAQKPAGPAGAGK